MRRNDGQPQQRGPRGAGPKGGFSLSQRIKHLQDLQAKLDEHTSAAVTDLSNQLKKTYEDVKVLADATPAGPRRDPLLKAQGHIRIALFTLTGEDIPVEGRKENPTPTPIAARMVPRDDVRPKPGEQNRTAQTNGRVPPSGQSSQELIDNLERSLGQ